MSLLSSYYAGQGRAQGGTGHPHPITTPERPPIGGGTEVVDLQEVTEVVWEGEAALEALVERAGARIGVLRRLLAEAQEIEGALLEKTSRLSACLTKTSDACGLLGARVAEAERLVARLDGAELAEMDRAVASLDRHSAQVQARVGVMLDEAEERLRQLRRKADALDGEGRQVERLELASDHLMRVIAQAKEADAALSKTVREARETA